MNDLPYLDAPRRAIAIICRTPDIIWLDFLAGFTSYDIFLIIDNDSYDCAALISAYSSIRFIQVDSEPCTAAGFTELNAVHFNNVTGWDKALYYFSCLNTAYQQIWLFEDDVFFYDENTIKNIDAKYADSDLLT
ncbi:MAG: hypothetical protein JO080_05615, partial [Mucilaginibacter sp.]|nr:hypothetical protein [Mucilaginibacter sp.]